MPHRIKNLEATWRDLEDCLKPGGLFLVIEGDYSYVEDRTQYVKLAKVEGDEDVDGVSEDGSWFRRMVWGKTL